MILQQCAICGTPTYAINIHHTSYVPETTIDICANCHFIINHPPQTLEGMAGLSEKLQYYIMLNFERKEQEKQAEQQSNIMKRTLLEMEMDWKYRLKNGSATYEIEVAETVEDIKKLCRQGFEQCDVIDGKHIFRKPDKKTRDGLPFWSFIKVDKTGLCGHPEGNECVGCKRTACPIYLKAQRCIEKYHVYTPGMAEDMEID